MRSKKVTRYYCDHCGKGGFKKPSMMQHELSCYRNPQRAYCPVCVEFRNTMSSSEELDNVMADAGFDAAKEVANHCPACIAASVSRYNAMQKIEDEKIWYDYKQEIEEFRRDHEESRSDQASQLNEETLKGLL